MPISNEQLFHDGDDFYEDVFTKFKFAKYSLHLEVHYLDDQALGHRFFLAIFEALNRGVHVSLIIDGFSPFSKKLKKWLALYKRKGGRVVFFHPLPWRRLCLRGLRGLNKRNHKKVFIIDSSLAYVGSLNVDTRQLSVKNGGEGWREVGVRIFDTRVRNLLKGFYDSWDYCVHGEINNRGSFMGDASIRLNHHSLYRKTLLNDLILRIRNAKNKIWITNPYFVPDKLMLNALIYAVSKGVDVKIIVPLKSDMKLFPLINSLFYRELLQKGIKVFEYKPSILHAKVMIIDEWVVMGSSNLNSRTQKHDWEVDIVLLSKESVEEMWRRFLEDLANSRELSYGLVALRYRDQRIKLPFIRAFKYFL